MEFKQLQSFEAVARLGSFTKAAEALYLSQPTISAHIMALESELDTQLIVRTTKIVELTPKGAEMYEYAVNILHMRDQMLVRCQEVEQSIIRLGASTIPAAYILPELLASYGKLQPNIYFSIQQSSSQDVAKGLGAGMFDLGFTGYPMESQDLVSIPFCKDRAVIITPVNDHFLALKKQGDLSLDDLLQEPIILREKESASQKNTADVLTRMGISEEDLQVRARVNDQEVVKNLVANGIGISILSEMAAKNFAQEKRILTFCLPDAAKYRSLYIVHRKNHPMKRYIQDFLDYAKNYYGN